MFTGRWPHELNVAETRPLDATHPTLAEFLAGRGYVTAGFVANTYYCNSWYGLGRGFVHYDDFYEDDGIVSLAETLRCSALGQRLCRFALGSQVAGRPRKDAGRINGEFLNWLSEHDQTGRPFFAFLNFFDAHDPYLLPPGAEHRFGPPLDDTALATLRNWKNRPKQNVSEGDAALVRDAYDNCVAYLDDQLGRLFDELERRGLLRNTLVIVTSDHGEQLGEHGLYGHGKSLYRQEVHVPLLIVPPGGIPEGRKVSEPVSLRNLPVTVADLIGRGGRSPFPGKSLARYWNSAPADDPTTAEPVLSEVSLRTKVSNNQNRPPAWRGPMKSVVAEGKVLIRNGDSREELYDLFQDPSELNDLAGSAAASSLLEQLRGTLERLLQEHRLTKEPVK